MEQDDASVPSPSSQDDDLEMISRQLRRDAMEQYLFIAEYMNQCGALWSPIIVAMFCYGFVYIATVVFQLLTLKQTPEYATLIFFYTLQIILLIWFPSFCLASANEVFAPIIHLFTNSSSDDFAMIGEGLHSVKFI